MANKKHVKILKRGLTAWNDWRVARPEIRPNLSSVDLSSADLSQANLSNADLTDINLRDAKLNDTDFCGANLRGANLTRARLHGEYLFASGTLIGPHYGAIFEDADLQGADLRSANLFGADLRKANLNRANLKGADLRNARLGGTEFDSARIGTTVFAGADLSEARSLEKVRHEYPSIVGTDSLSKSRGRIPKAFLRGCGLADWEVEIAELYDPNLNEAQRTDIVYKVVKIQGESPIQVNSIFISYSHLDSDFVEALEPRLDKKRVRFWRDVHHATAGPLEEIVDRAMRVNSIVLLVLSESSVESDWVEWEVRKARKLAKERKEHVLCPIALDDSWQSCSWPGRLRAQVEEYNILDFSEWQEADAMGTAFQKLIDGLGLFYPKSPQQT